MSSGAYLSSDDSVLLRGVLERYSGGSCLEIGAGNGGGLVELSRRFKMAVGTDIQRPSGFKLRDSIDFVLADCASCFREQSFDLVAFNPPYLPSEQIEDRTVDGGEEGEAVAMRFLGEAIRVSKKDGKIVALLSSENPLAPLERLCERDGFSMRLVGTKHLFYETLSVYEIAQKRR